MFLDTISLLGVLSRIASSLLSAGILYSLWLGIFILSVDSIGPISKALLWIAAPIVTALGFSIGMALGEAVTKVTRSKFIRIFIWPFVGCSIGAGILYWFGPMLIVFGMFALGTGSVMLREILFIRVGRVPKSPIQSGRVKPDDDGC